MAADMQQQIDDTNAMISIEHNYRLETEDFSNFITNKTNVSMVSNEMEEDSDNNQEGKSINTITQNNRKENKVEPRDKTHDS